jgi:hypothetical protein
VPRLFRAVIAQPPPVEDQTLGEAADVVNGTKVETAKEAADFLSSLILKRPESWAKNKSQGEE